MQETFVENIRKVLQNKPQLEKELKIRITNKGKNIFVEGKPENEFIALKVLEAINLNFSVETALLLKDDEILIHTLSIKNLTKRQDLERVRARIIGTRGKTLKTLKNLTNCNFSLSDNYIGIIGDCKEIQDAIQSITSLIQGSKQGNVYARLEKQRKRKRLKQESLIIGDESKENK